GDEQALQRERRDAERHRHARPEQRRLKRDLGDVDEHPRPEPPAPEGGDVRAERDLVPGTALEVAPDGWVDLRRGRLEIVRDVDHRANLSSALRAISRSPPYASSRGAATNGSQRASATSLRIRSSMSPSRPPRPARRR